MLFLYERFKYLILIFIIVPVVCFGFNLEDEKLSSIHHETNCTRAQIHCLTLSEIIHKTKNYNFESREKAELLFQTRMRIKEQLSNLLPNLNIGMALGFGQQQYLSVLPTLVGFIFPSNWFNWKESKMIYLAQKYSYEALLANQMLVAESLFYNIHRLKHDYKIYFNALKRLVKVIELLDFALTDKGILEAKRSLKSLKSFYSEVKLEAIRIENALNTIIPELNFLMAGHGSWANMTIEEIELPDLSTVVRSFDPESIVKNVLDRSRTLKSLKYYETAARYARLSRALDFFSFQPDDSGIGLGLVARVKIQSSQMRLFKIRQEEYENSVRTQLYKIVSNYKFITDIYDEIQIGKNNTKTVLLDLIRDLEEHGKLNVGLFVDLYERDIKFQRLHNYAQHMFLINQAQYFRLLLEGEQYKDLSIGIPSRKKMTGRRNRGRYKEDLSFNAAVSRGEIVDKKN